MAAPVIFISLAIAALSGCLGSGSEQSQPHDQDEPQTPPKPKVLTQLDLVQTPLAYTNSKQATFIFEWTGEIKDPSQIVYKLTKPNEEPTDGNWKNCDQCHTLDEKRYTRTYVAEDLLQDGQYTFSLGIQNTQIDQIKAQQNYKWTVDTQPPTINLTVTNQADAPNATDTMGFHFEVTDTYGTNSAQCRLKTPSMEFTQWVDCQNPQNYTALLEGAHVFELQATDQARNTAMESHAWNVMAPKPELGEDRLTIPKPIVETVPTTPTDTLELPTVSNVSYDLSVAESEIRVLEGERAQVEIHLSSPPETDISFFWSTVEGSANGGTNLQEKDFQRVDAKRHTIRAGAMSSTLNVSIHRDHTYEFHKESFSLSFAKDPSHPNLSLPSNTVRIFIQDAEKFYLNEDMSYVFDEETDLSDITSISLTFNHADSQVNTQLYPVRLAENEHYNFHRNIPADGITVTNNKIHIPKHNYFNHEDESKRQYNLPFETEISLEIEFSNREKTTVSFTTIDFPTVNKNVREQSKFTNNIAQFVYQLTTNFIGTETKTDFEHWTDQIKWPSLNTEQKNKIKDNQETHGLSYAVKKEIHGESVKVLLVGRTILQSSSVYQSVVWKTFDFEDELLDLEAYHEQENGDHSHAISPNRRVLGAYTVNNEATKMARHILNYAPKVDIYNYNFRDRFIRLKRELLRKVTFIQDVLANENIDIVSLPIQGGDIFEVLSNPEEYLKTPIDNGLVLVAPLGNEMAIRNIDDNCAISSEILFLPYLYDLKDSHGGLVAIQAVREDTENGVTKHLARTHAGNARHYTLSVLETGNEGTMEATAVFSGMMAIMIEANRKFRKNYTNRQLLEILIESAQDIGVAGVDDLFGHGLVDMKTALERLENGKPPSYKLYHSLEKFDVHSCSGHAL